MDEDEHFHEEEEGDESSISSPASNVSGVVSFQLFFVVVC